MYHPQIPWQRGEYLTFDDHNFSLLSMHINRQLYIGKIIWPTRIFSQTSKVLFGRWVSSRDERSTEYVFHVIKWDHKLTLDDKLDDREELEKVGVHYMIQVGSFSFKLLYEGINLGIWFMSCQLHSIGENLMGPENSNYSCQCNISCPLISLPPAVQCPFPHVSRTREQEGEI